jgi:hypothetical protein
MPFYKVRIVKEIPGLSDTWRSQYRPGKTAWAWNSYKTTWNVWNGSHHWGRVQLDASEIGNYIESFRTRDGQRETADPKTEKELRYQLNWLLET